MHEYQIPFSALSHTILRSEIPIKATEKWKWMSLISLSRLFQLSRLMNWTVPFWPMNWLIDNLILLIFYYSRNSRAHLYFFFFFYPPSIPPIRHMYFYLKFVLARHHIISLDSLCHCPICWLRVARPPASQPTQAPFDCTLDFTPPYTHYYYELASSSLSSPCLIYYAL